MSLTTEWVRYGHDGRYKGYAAWPASFVEPQPSILILQEIWGVDRHIQDVARRFASAGYVAFAPDYFSVDGEREEALTEERVEEAKSFLNELPPAVWRDVDGRARALASGHYAPEQRERIEATLGRIFATGARLGEFAVQTLETAGFLRDTFEPSCGRKTAAVGFCFGGSLAIALAAQDSALSGAVTFYGAAPQGIQLEAIQCPVFGIYGEADRRVTETVPVLEAGLLAAGKSFRYHIYPDAQHAFFNDTRPTYNAEAAREAYARTLNFLWAALH
ncbi:dienelactone hydrolase family protein [Paenibacillus athensensis]|uniref:Dienelactone hydrolase n=1 Tax=Paenibacillus athensensis TaxID=1967502 RepID=A0A4Y8Q512_9BACL|nr:dienelactone hydrolase family protein [Paenibacillus athensensis]MCD1258415.1 dienelactone hydrolase family protein [Paenibacillus athensensis]